MKTTLCGLGMVLCCMAGASAPVMAAENAVPRDIDRVKITSPEYSYEVNGHVLRVEWRFQSRVVVTYDGKRMPVVVSDDGWSASNRSRSIAFEGYFWDYVDGENTIPVANIKWTGADEFREVNFIEVVADETLAEIFGVDVGEVIGGNMTVVQWNLAPTQGTSTGSAALATETDLMQESDPTVSALIAAAKCGCFRSTTPASCTIQQCNDTDSCGTGVCMEIDNRL